VQWFTLHGQTEQGKYTMSGTSGHMLSVEGLFAERDATRRRDKDAEEQLQRRKEEELTEFRNRLENFQLTDKVIESGIPESGAHSSEARPS
jgi:hypothetical protein